MFSDQIVAIKNKGGLNITLGNLAEENTLNKPFSLINDTCSGKQLMPETSCAVIVRFKPESIGSFSDDFDIPSDTTDTVTVSLVGEGVGIAVADITVSDSSLPIDDLQIPFGDVTQMMPSIQMVTVSNDGNANLLIGNIASANSLSSPFSVDVDKCSNQEILPGISCTFSVKFESTGLGTFSDGFDIPSNDPDEAFTIVSVNGIGVAYSAVSDIVVTDSTAPADDLLVDFGDVEELESSVQVVMIANDGDANLAISNIAQDNPLYSPFEILVDNCSMTMLAPTESCTLDLRFSPTIGSETFQDSFDIPSSDLDEDILTIVMKGSGLVRGTNESPSIGNSSSPDIEGSSSSNGSGSLNPLLLAFFATLVLVKVVRLRCATKIAG